MIVLISCMELISYFVFVFIFYHVKRKEKIYCDNVIVFREHCFMSLMFTLTDYICYSSADLLRSRSVHFSKPMDNNLKKEKKKEATPCRGFYQFLMTVQIFYNIFFKH